MVEISDIPTRLVLEETKRALADRTSTEYIELVAGNIVLEMIMKRTGMKSNLIQSEVKKRMIQAGEEDELTALVDYGEEIFGDYFEERLFKIEIPEYYSSRG